MTTANEIVTDAAALILVDEANTGMDPDEFALGVRFLNDLCAELYDDDVDFGYRPVASASDFITSPSSVNSALKFMLAVRMNPLFGLPLPPEVFNQATKLEASLTNRYQRSLSQAYPDTLPIGSGNDVDSFQVDEFYRTAMPEAFLRLTSAQTISIAAINTPVAISSGFSVDRQSNVDISNGAVTFIPDGQYYAMFEAVLTIPAGREDLFTFYFAKNGVLLKQSAVSARDGEGDTVKVRWAENLRKDDVVTLMVENNDNTNDLTINNGSFRVT